MNDIFSILCVFILLPYVLVPMLIRRNQLFSLQPKLRQILGGILPNPVESYFNQITKELEPLGFDHKIDVVSLDYGPNMRVFMRFFVATKQSIMATCSSLLVDGADMPLRNFLEFNTRCIDGREISTHNSDLASAPIEHRQKMTSVLPFVKDANTLFLVHQKIVQKLDLNDQALLIPRAKEEFQYMVQSFKDDLSRQVALGCLQFDNRNNCYRPTWAGAFLMGWYSMWPISAVRRFIQKIRAKIRMRRFAQS